MSSHLAPKVLAIKAGADLSAKQFCFVKFGATKETVVACGNAEMPLGVLLNKPLADEEAEVAVLGGAEVKCAGVIPVGGHVGSNADGEAVEVTTGLAFGVAMDAAVDNDVIGILIDRIKL
jgi:hypothetical protein